MSFTQRFHDIAAEVRNWGRWGDDDRIGTLNLITEEARVAAAASVEHGRAISLAIDLKKDGPQIGQIPTRINPIHVMGTIDHADLGDPDGKKMVAHFSDDMVTMGLQAGTHWDGLSHASYNGTLYNGVPTSSITAREGATVLGVEHVGPIVGRGVLLDIPGTKGVDRLEDGYEINSEDLDEAAEWAGVTMQPGDIVLIRTGRMQLYLEGGAMAYAAGANMDGATAGPGLDAARWFHRNDIAAVATDTYIFEVFPGPVWDDVLGVHCLCLVEMGMTQGQNWNLEDLAATCVEFGRHHFFLNATPEPFVGATGSPVNPVAIF
jgi:kynurenine formamidase